MESAFVGLILDSSVVIAGEGGRQHPVTIAIARLAGHIECNQAAQGVVIAFEDLLIAATAIQIQLGYSVATGNIRHFAAVPGLTVVRA